MHLSITCFSKYLKATNNTYTSVETHKLKGKEKESLISLSSEFLFYFGILSQSCRVKYAKKTLKMIKVYQ